MEKIIELPEDIKASIDKRTLVIRGPKGEVERNFNDPKYNLLIDISKEKNTIKLSSTQTTRKIKATMGTYVSHIKNMMTGVKTGHAYKLSIEYIHFPINTQVKEDKLYIKNFLGEKQPRIAKILTGVEVNTTKEEIIVKGLDKEKVGQTAANIEKACKVPNRDIRVFQDGIYITEKEAVE